MSKTIKTGQESFKIDYTEERLEDEVLAEIKNFCNTYLLDVKSVNDATDDELFAMYSFLVVKFDDVKKLKKSLDIKNYCCPFVDSSKIIDEITLSDSIFSYSEKSNLFLLTKELNYVNDILMFCFGIIKKISSDRSNLKQRLL